MNTFAWGDSTANPTSLAEFVISAMTANPNADTVILSLVGHGGGWSPRVLNGQPTKRGGQPSDYETGVLGGLLWDVHHSDALSTADLAHALELIESASGKNLDLLYLDACLMAMSEVAFEIHESANYLLASESWSWTTFPYDKHIEAAGAIMTGSGDETEKAPSIGKAWLANEVAEISENDNYPFSYSLIALRRMPDVQTAENRLAEALIAAFNANNQQTRDRMDRSFAATDCVDSDQSGRIEHDSTIGWADNYCDLGSLATAVGDEFSDTSTVVDAAQSIMQALDGTTRSGAVIANAFRSGTPHTYSDLPWIWKNLTGLTRYSPLGQDEWKRRYYNDLFLPSSIGSKWGEMLATYWDSTVPDVEDLSNPICPEEGCAMPPSALPFLNVDAMVADVDGGIRVDWRVDPDPDLVSTFVVQRVLYPLTSEPEKWIIPNAMPDTTQPFSYTDTTATGSFEYCYQVMALNQSEGRLAFSNFDCNIAEIGDTPLTSAPQVGASDTSTSILVKWGSIQAAGSAGGYRVYRSTNRGQWLPQNDELITESQYEDSAVVGGVEYCYLVHTIGEDGKLLEESDKACTYLGSSPQFNYLPLVHK